MDWLDAGLNQLIEGLTLNIVGLSGSGRSESLRTLAAALGEDDWVAESWPLSDLRTMTRAQMTASVNRLRDPARIPVLLIDDFGEFLMEGDGQWFERMLFNRTTHPDPDGLPTLRCVVVTPT